MRHRRGVWYILFWSYICTANSVWVMRKYYRVTICFLIWFGVQARVTKSKQKVNSISHLKPSGSSPWSCNTKSGESCVLPFKHYGGKEYTTCSAAGSSDAWCPTRVRYAQGGQYNFLGRKGHGWNWCDVNECYYGESLIARFKATQSSFLWRRNSYCFPPTNTTTPATRTTPIRTTRGPTAVRPRQAPLKMPSKCTKNPCYHYHFYRTQSRSILPVLVRHSYSLARSLSQPVFVRLEWNAPCMWSFNQNLWLKFGQNYKYKNWSNFEDKLCSRFWN